MGDGSHSASGVGEGSALVRNEGTAATSQRPSGLWRGAHIFALSGFAIAQPLFDLLGTQPDFWIARQATIGDVTALVVVVVVFVPLGLWAI